MAPAARSDAHRGAGVALCLLSACGFGLMAILAKGAYGAGVGVGALLAGRFALAAAALWALVALRRAARVRRARRGRARAGSPAPPARRAVLAGLALGAVGYSLQAGFFFSALARIDASLSALLLYTYPALVVIGALALGREGPSAPKAIALVLASAGAALVLLGGDAGELRAGGVLLALAAGATYAVYLLVADGVAERVDALALGALVTTGAAATFAVAGAAAGGLAFPAAAWPWIAALALASTVLPIVALLGGMRRVGPSTASILSTVEPLVTVGLAVALLGETLGPAQLLGAALVLAAVASLQLGTARRAPALARQGA